MTKGKHSHWPRKIPLTVLKLTDICRVCWTRQTVRNGVFVQHTRYEESIKNVVICEGSEESPRSKGLDDGTSAK